MRRFSRIKGVRGLQAIRWLHEVAYKFSYINISCGISRRQRKRNKETMEKTASVCKGSCVNLLELLESLSWEKCNNIN
uniref:Uncharacterized protein n=1 Tax=Rhizophora mucronata TaxID=61149 RepID=A0A2P2P014_RHIMU